MNTKSRPVARAEIADRSRRIAAGMIVALASCWFAISAPQRARAEQNVADVGMPSLEAEDTALPEEEVSSILDDTSPDIGAGAGAELDQGWSGGRAPGRDTTWIAGADYLLLRPSFGNSTALLLSTRTGGPGGASSLDSINYDFGYSGGVRAFVGYQASPEHVFRFTYTSFFAQTSASGNATGNWLGGQGTAVLGPFSSAAFAPGTFITSRARVNLNIYDLEWAKRLGAVSASSCPVWDVAAGAGVRILDSAVDSGLFNQGVAALAVPDVVVTTRRVFGGAGPRLSGQVRRYFGENRRWSGFGAVGGSLLVGGLSNSDFRLASDVPNPQQQRTGGPTVIPNVDLSLGGTWQIRPQTSLSAGWMLVYFGGLGYSETVSLENGAAIVNNYVGYTNSSLSLDGFFCRFTHAF